MCERCGKVSLTTVTTLEQLLTLPSLSVIPVLLPDIGEYTLVNGLTNVLMQTVRRPLPAGPH